MTTGEGRGNRLSEAAVGPPGSSARPGLALGSHRSIGNDARPTRFGERVLARDTRYSYTCHACSRCCHHQQIMVNPFELLAIARHLSVSTTTILEQYVDGGSYLRRRENGACVFLGTAGCSVHPARPLVCRLYPLGRHRSSDGSETFSHVNPHPETEGEWGTRGTVGDFLGAQGADEYISAADRYLTVLADLLAQVAVEAGNGADVHAQIAGRISDGARSLPELLDPDAAIAAERPDLDSASLAPDAAMAVHIEIINGWLGHLRQGGIR